MSQADLASKTKSKTEKPKRYTVVFLNDDFTPVDFVMQVMMQVFKQGLEEAERITLDIHKKGKGTVGVYSHEVAEAKVAQVMSAARRYEYPLTCSPAPID